MSRDGKEICRGRTKIPSRHVGGLERGNGNRGPRTRTRRDEQERMGSTTEGQLQFIQTRRMAQRDKLR